MFQSQQQQEVVELVVVIVVIQDPHLPLQVVMEQPIQVVAVEVVPE
jgi:hypothetical protein